MKELNELSILELKALFDYYTYKKSRGGIASNLKIIEKKIEQIEFVLESMVDFNN